MGVQAPVVQQVQQVQQTRVVQQAPAPVTYAAPVQQVVQAPVVQQVQQVQQVVQAPPREAAPVTYAAPVQQLAEKHWHPRLSYFSPCAKGCQWISVRFFSFGFFHCVQQLRQSVLTKSMQEVYQSFDMD